MILALNVYDIDITNIFISNKEVNLISDYKYFHKLFYSNSNYLMNGLYIKLNLIDYKSSVFYNYIKINYNIEKNISFINKIYEIEKNILTDISSSYKNNLYNDLMQGTIKIQKKNYSPKQIHIILKITGIWENNNICGLCYKFLLL